MKTQLLNQFRIEKGIFSSVLKNIFTIGFILISFCGWSQNLTGLIVSAASGTRTYGIAGTITYTITATRSNNGGATAIIAISSLPSGVTASFSSTRLSYSGSIKTATTTLTLTTTALAASVTNSSFTVTASANNSVNNTGAFTINKATPTVSVSPIASSITYGQNLSSSILSGGTSSVPGSFAFTNPSTAPNAGTASQGVTFTPTDTANYNTTTTTSSVIVNKAMPTVSVSPTASSITYGQNLSSSILSGGTSSVPGSFAFTNPSTSPNAGTVSQGITFTPTDTSNYNTTTTTSSVIVNKATPTITLIVSNSPTTYTGLNQSATVSIADSPILGTVSNILTGGATSQTNADTYSVTADFVPTDIANYNIQTGLFAGNFIINPASLSITANNASKCYGETYDLLSSTFTFSGLISPDTISNVLFTCSGSGSSATSGSYSIEPSVATGGTFLSTNYSITYNDGVLTVNPTNTAGVASSSPTLCVNTSLTEITHSTTGATGIGAVTGLPPGIIASWASDTITISGTPTLSGTFIYSITLMGGCGSVNATGTIIVGDFTAPVLVGVPSNITVSCDTIPVAATPTAKDNCDANPIISFVETSTQTITGISHFNYSILREWSVTDAHGNVSVENQVINVIDSTAPVADVLSLEGVTGECSATITTVPTATDNCNGIIVGTTSDLLTRTTQGTSTVTWTFTDAVGNTSTQTQDIVVIDTIAPVANALSLPDVIGDCSVTISSYPTATDNCSGIIIGTTTDPLTRSAINGRFKVTWKFIDAAGNISTQIQYIVLSGVPARVAALTTSDSVLCKYIGTTNTVTFTATAYTASPVATSYIWSVTPGVTIISGQGTNVLEVDFHSAPIGTGDIKIGEIGVKAVSAFGCSSTETLISLLTKLPWAPTKVVLTHNNVSINSVGDFVGDASKTLVLTATENSGTANRYRWELPVGVNVVNGDKDNDKVITINFGNVQPGITDLALSVNSEAGCGSSIAKTLKVTRYLPGTLSALVLTNDAISPLSKITNVSAYTGKLKTTTLTLTATPYTTAGYQASSYKWILPSGIAIVAASANFISEDSGFKTYTSSTNVIHINLSGVETATSFLLKVYGVNGNGESLLSRNLNLTSAKPVKPGTLTTLSGAVPTYHPTCNTITVKVPNVLGVSYLWSITGVALATIVSYNSEGNEATIDVSQLLSTALSSFKINVTASNGTGTSLPSIYTIKLGSPCASNFRLISQKNMIQEIVSSEFNAIAYPNPSSGVFNIKIQSSYKEETEVKVLDMTGRLIEQFKIQSDSVELGSRYPSGIYNVIVNQGGKFKILQIIKN